MTQEEIFEYNKRCAEFLGWKLDSEHSKYLYYSKNKPRVQVWDYRSMLYDLDWNWIMEVVEAIEKLGFATKIDHDYCISNYGCDRCEIDTKENALYYPDEEEDKEEPIVFELTKSKKEAVVQAINQFLIWYIENKNK